MIYFFTAYSFKKNLGEAYNRYMALLPNDDDWACFTDGDAMFLTSDFGHQIQFVINNHPKAGIITCLTNRIGNLNLHQCYMGQRSTNPSIIHHRKIARKLRENYYSKTQKYNRTMGGYMMTIKKAVWKKVPFQDGNLLHIDTRFSKDIIEKGYSILVMQGLYCFHYYRLLEGHKYKEHLRVDI